MSLWDALRMNMMISYQELVRTFLRTLGIGGLGLVNHKLNHHKSPSFLGRENKLSVVIQTELITNGYHFTVG